MDNLDNRLQLIKNVKPTITIKIPKYQLL